MSTTHLTIRVPLELKKRLEQEAKHQGVSVNHLTTYLLTIQMTQLEMLASLETKFAHKSIPELKTKVRSILDQVPSRDVPEWDKRES